MTLRLRATACDRHRAALTDFIDHRERGPATPAALDHLAACRRCEAEMTEVALTIVALRRLGSSVASAQPRAARPHVPAARVVPSPRRRLPGFGVSLGALRGSALAGPVLSLGLVALLLVPPRPIAGPATPTPAAAAATGASASTLPAAALEAAPQEPAALVAVNRSYDPPAQPLTPEVVRAFLTGTAPAAVAWAPHEHLARDRSEPARAAAHDAVTPGPSGMPLGVGRT